MMVIEMQGEIIEVLGMTEEECRTVVRGWSEIVTVTIQPINAPLHRDAGGGSGASGG